MARKRLGEVLLERGIIDHDQLNSALAYQRQWGHRIGVAMVAKGFITEGMLVKVLSETMSLPAVDLSTIEFDKEALRTISFTICENNDLIPLKLEHGRGGNKTMILAMADPMNLAVIDEIEFTTSCKVRPVLATISAINSAIRKHYRGMNTIIRPLSLIKPETDEASRMQLVRPGGNVEEVDTSTHAPTDPNRKAPVQSQASGQGLSSRVEEIKARRAQQVAQSRSDVDGITSEEAMEAFLSEVQNTELEKLNKLEKYFWALMRVMAKKGLISKDEFLREMDN
ncbi:MAG: hypothetical protein JRF33_14380 [Deltaproteobacteria bacterium]|nr:hypothetical protein [Deltaproteobacteria bacterium]